MIKVLIKYITFALALILFTYCSELKDEIPAVPKVSIHGIGLYDTASPNYHVKTILASPNGIYDCQQCHAADFSGGTAKVGCNTPDCHPTIDVHKAGINDPTNAQFHGNYIRSKNWDMISCQSCHGTRYAGGVASPTCNDCHSLPLGPENCSTCHGSAISPAPPRDLSGNTSSTSPGVGAHQIHLTSTSSSKGRILSCAECHSVPTSMYVPGHVDSPYPAEIMFNNYLSNLITNDPTTSRYSPNLPLFVPNPTYDYSSQSCANSYCHGHFKNGNLTNSPSWTDPNSAVCGTCHGDPSRPTLAERSLPKTSAEGGTHPNNLNCSNCHGGVVNANLNFTNPSKHIDGLLNLFGEDIKY